MQASGTVGWRTFVTATRIFELERYLADTDHRHILTAPQHTPRRLSRCTLIAGSKPRRASFGGGQTGRPAIAGEGIHDVYGRNVVLAPGCRQDQE